MKILLIIFLGLRLIMCQSSEFLIDFYFLNDNPSNLLTENGVLTLESVDGGGVDIFLDSRQVQVDKKLSTLHEEWRSEVVFAAWTDDCFYELILSNNDKIYPVDRILVGFGEGFVVEAYFFEPTEATNLQIHKDFEVYIKGKLYSVLSKGEKNEKAHDFCRDPFCDPRFFGDCES